MCWTTCATTRACCGWSKARYAPTGQVPRCAPPTKPGCAPKPCLWRWRPDAMGSLYSEHTTWLHSWRAGTKLALLALLGTLLFVLQQPWMLVAAATVCTAVYASLGAATQAARRLMVSVLV